MKILVLTNKLPFPAKDGGSIASLNMLSSLHQAGFQVSCLAINTLKHHFPVDQIPEKYRDRIRFLAVDGDTRIRPLRLLANLLFSRKPYIAMRFLNGDYARALEKELKEERYELVQLEGPYMGHYIPLIRRHSKARIVLRAHNVENQIWARKADNEALSLKKGYLQSLARRLERFERDVASSCDALLCISPRDENWFRDQGLDKATITLPAALDCDAYPRTPLPRDPSIFFIGALDWMPNEEGLQWFIQEVLPRLVEKDERIRLHVAGRNAPAHVEALLEGEHIVYHGEVEDAKSFMQAHRLMVAPLLTGSGIRIKILEAMALGRPVVTTSIGIEGIPARAGKEVEVEDRPEAFQKQVQTLLQNEEKANSNVEHAHQMIRENFDTFGHQARLSRFLREQV